MWAQAKLILLSGLWSKQTSCHYCPLACCLSADVVQFLWLLYLVLVLASQSTKGFSVESIIIMGFITGRNV